MAGYKLGIIGLGRMGSEIAKAVIEHKLVKPEEIIACDPNSSQCGPLAERGVKIAATNSKVTLNAPLVLLAVKPQKIDEVLDDIQGSSNGTCFVSILAGMPSGYIKSRLPSTAYVIPVLPNTPLVVGKAATVIAKPDDIPLEFYRAVVSMFSAVGDVVFIDEEYMNATIPIAGSAPAFFYRMAANMLTYSDEAGIDPIVAGRLIAQSMEGAASMLRESGKAPKELINQVASPGGTTVAAMKQMDIHGFDDAMLQALSACKLKADELSRYRIP